VDQAIPLFGPVGLGPVGCAGHRGRHGRQGAEADQPPGRTAIGPGAGDVQHGSGDPGADRDIGQQRVQLMPEPGARQGVIDRCRPGSPGDDRGERPADAVKRLGCLQALDGHVHPVHYGHVPSLSLRLP
jgi:hypothetical protein